MPPDITLLDLVAFGWFATAWCGYILFVDYGHGRLRGLNAHLWTLRRQWAARLLERDNRIADAALVGHTIRSVTFFASTTVLLLAGLLGILGAVDAAHGVTSQFTFVDQTSKAFFGLKLLLLLVILVFAFMKFTWAVRQYNYGIALIGSAPMPAAPLTVREPSAEHIATVLSLAGVSFNGGLRAYYFALALLGWFIHPGVCILATAWVLLILLRRQYWSRTHAAIRRQAELLAELPMR